MLAYQNMQTNDAFKPETLAEQNIEVYALEVCLRLVIVFGLYHRLDWLAHAASVPLGTSAQLRSMNARASWFYVLRWIRRVCAFKSGYACSVWRRTVLRLHKSREPPRIYGGLTVDDTRRWHGEAVVTAFQYSGSVILQ